jgi:hypothetical protein
MALEEATPIPHLEVIVRNPIPHWVDCRFQELSPLSNLQIGETYHVRQEDFDKYSDPTEKQDIYFYTIDYVPIKHHGSPFVTFIQTEILQAEIDKTRREAEMKKKQGNTHKKKK